MCVLCPHMEGGTSIPGDTSGDVTKVLFKVVMKSKGLYMFSTFYSIEDLISIAKDLDQ